MGDRGSSQTTAVIFAGGLGTRLRAAVSDRPKVLAEVLGRPFLAYLLDQVAAAGVRRVVLSTGYLGEQVEAAFGAEYGSLEVAYSKEDSPLGTGGALRHALGMLESDPVLVMNGDSYFDSDLNSLWAAYEEKRAEGAMLLCQVPDVARFGQVVVDDVQALVSFEEKGGKHGPGWINAGQYLLGRRVVESIPEGRAVSLEKEVLPAWIGRGLYGVAGEGKFLDIGTPESYAEAEAFFGAG